jgi:hypothetical protein
VYPPCVFVVLEVSFGGGTGRDFCGRGGTARGLLMSAPLCQP